MVGVVAIGQNSLRTEGRALVTVIPSSTAASTGSTTLPIIAGQADWSVQIIPVAGGVLTSDSVYATVKTYFSNSSGAYTVYSEPKTYITEALSTVSSATVLPAYLLRDTIANTTVALSPGVYISGSKFPGSRIKIEINRPQSTDSVNYYVYWTIKYPQSNPQR